MKNKFLLTLAISGFVATQGAQAIAAPKTPAKADPAPVVVEAKKPEEPPKPRMGAPLKPGLAGQFLSSHFAQSENDWEAANRYLDPVLADDTDNADLIKRSMILAMGAGNLPLAARRAQELVKYDPANSLAWLIETVNLLAKNEPKQAAAALDKMPEGDVTEFVRPVVKGWIEAAQGRLNTTNFNMTTLHSYSGALIARHLDKKKEVNAFIQRIIDVGTLSPYDVERMGDLLAAIGDNKRAIEMYQGVLKQQPANKTLEKKVKLLEEKQPLTPALNPVLRVTTPAQGVAVAMTDLARLLFQEYSDSSARIFGQMALALDPDMTDAKLLMAQALARAGRYQEAIAYFSSVGPDQDNYIEVQHYIADLMNDAGQTDKAMELLNNLFMKHNDVESLIRIGDMYRGKEKYDNALKAYNRAAGQIGKDIPEEYWHLLYARGMVYEREGDWHRAEQDLKAALVFRPDHPYLLNYLGYAWADQGVNLDESLKLIERAATLRPDDGFIKDSLGWVLYMMGRYPEAVPALEKAVELMPYDPVLNDHLGDAYWQVGRHLEARFQWQRAFNYAGKGDDKLKETVSAKLENGMPPQKPVKEAHSGAAGQKPVNP